MKIVIRTYIHTHAYTHAYTSHMLSKNKCLKNKNGFVFNILMKE